MRIIIDGDSCPVLNIIEDIVLKYNIEAYIYCDYTHNISSDYVHVINTDSGYQSVDMKILSILKPHDILVTNDYGLASLVLTHNITAISYKGLIYNQNNIETLLNMNYVNKKLRKEKIHVKGPSKRSLSDDDNFIESLLNVIKKNLSII